MKIVVTGTRGIPNILGGVETHCEELFPRIVQQGYNVTVICRKGYKKDTYKEYKGVHLLNIGTSPNKLLEAIIHTFKSVWIAKFILHADLIHIHAIGPAIMTPLARLLGMKVVFTHHGADYERAKWGRIAKWVLRFGERMGVKYANKVIVISEVINSHIIYKYGRNDINLIFNGVNIPVKTHDTSYLDTLGIQKGNYVFAMGRFVPEKGFERLINVFAELNLKEIQLVIAGDTDHEDKFSKKLKNLAREKKIILTGFIKGEKLNELLTNTRLFVIPSYHEGLPIALLEAMSFKLDVLASDIPANKTIGLPNDCYFENKNEIDFLNKLSLKISKPVFNREYDMSAYNWDIIAKETASVYSKLF
ncbi:MAG TPA: glycosyltransferase family 4 protein [Candidatus Paceibacterota bacterium]